MTTAIVPRRLFDEGVDPDDDRYLTSGDATELKANGMIRVHGVIPIRLNERLKSMARAQNRTADLLIGELIQKTAKEVDRWEAEQYVSQLRERFGDNWMEILGAVHP